MVYTRRDSSFCQMGGVIKVWASCLLMYVLKIFSYDIIKLRQLFEYPTTTIKPPPPSSQTNVFSIVILALLAEISPSANKITGHWLCSVSACCDTSLSRWLYFLRECNVEPKDFKAIKWGFIIQKAFKIFCFCWLSLSVVVFQMLFRGIGTTSVSVAGLFLHWPHFNPIPALGFDEWFIARTHSASQPFVCDLPLLVACEVSCYHCFFCGF